jgi:DNA-binding transcriptional LysR family regulator
MLRHRNLKENMIDKLEISHLRTLSALYKYGNISSAAEYLAISQQAVSLQLKKMRTILHDSLFVRSGHGMVPTPYARLIESHVNTILAHLNDIPLSDALTPSQVERTLVISATDYTQTVVVGALLKTLRTSAPHVKVMVIQIESASLIQKMHHGDIDLALTSNSYVPEGLISVPLFTEQYRCVSANASIAVDPYLTLDKLVEHDFVVVSPGIASLRGSADTWFEQQGLRRRVALSVPSFFMAQTYLQQTDMVGFLPSRLLPCTGLHDIALEKYPPGYEVVAAYHPRANNDPFMMWLIDIIKQQCHETT